MDKSVSEGWALMDLAEPESACLAKETPKIANLGPIWLPPLDASLGSGKHPRFDDILPPLSNQLASERSGGGNGG
jgi:hypothetical protein